jgi:hypothetical protein
MYGLVVKQPWADMLVDGSKTWEIRRTNTKRRGRIFILSNGEKIGEGNLTAVHGPCSVDELENYIDKHKVNNEFLRKYSRGKKLFAWEISAKRIRKTGYKHPKGAIIWVKM